MNDSTRPPWTTPSGQKTSRRQSHRSRSKTSGRQKQGRYQRSAPHTAQRQRMQQMRKPHSKPPTMRFPSNMVSGGKPLTTSTDNNHQCAGHPLGAFFDPPARFFCIWEKCDAQGKSVFATPPTTSSFTRAELFPTSSGGGSSHIFWGDPPSRYGAGGV